MAQNNGLTCFGDVLHIGLINLNHSRPATALVNQDIVSKNLDILCVTEPYYTDTGVANFPPKYAIIADNHKPRSASVIINNKIHFTIINQLRDISIVCIFFKDSTYILLNVYSPPSGNFNDVLDLLESYLVKYKEEHIIITGDFNAKHDL